MMKFLTAIVEGVFKFMAWSLFCATILTLAMMYYHGGMI
jgi:hypothetical protein